MIFFEPIIIWYSNNKRNLPWRDTKNPYFIWLSEIILQQTRVVQGMPYFYAFTENYPDIKSLANAEEQAVLRLWQGLGYYSRARNLHFTAKYIVNELNGIFPNKYEDLLKLKGVGDYTAAAIASFCYNESVPVVDGNVLRVISRLFLIETPIDETNTKKIIKNIVQENIASFNPAIFNQALMEFGALQCKPEPTCSTCPLTQCCNAFLHSKTNVIPFKNKKIKQKIRYINYLVPIINENGTISTLMKKRTGKDIWLNLYDFITIESETAINMVEIKENDLFKKISNSNYTILKIVENQVHQLTHQKLICNFIIFDVNKISEEFIVNKTSASEIENLPKPIVIENFLVNHLYPIISKL